ncbi:MAG: anthranilate phosphoribosyltransferase [Gemmatimonadota bacterium]
MRRKLVRKRAIQAVIAIRAIHAIFSKRMDRHDRMDRQDRNDLTDRPEINLAAIIARIGSRADLSIEDAEAAFVEVMEGRATPVQVAALLVGLRVKGEQPSEIAGGVQALRRAMIPVVAPEDWTLVDTCGTGGGAVTTFNISTAAALLAAGAGVRIAKHGNRSFSSRCGSADVLEALGIRIELKPEQMSEVLARAGIVFMFAPLLHPAMRHVAPIRRELAMPTIMNLLGPLANPAGARRQIVGVSHPALLGLIAGGLQELGHERALVVHGEPGLDELSPLGKTTVIELKDGKLDRFELDPREWGIKAGKPEDLAGFDPVENALIIKNVLAGKGTRAARHAVTLNAGAAIYLASLTNNLKEGWQLAEQALAEGKGIAALENLRAATNAFG